MAQNGIGDPSCLDYADTVVKEWLAAYLEVNPSVLFPDYTGEYDDMGFIIDGKQYVAYLVIGHKDEYPTIDIEFITKHKESYNAYCQLIDAVNSVFNFNTHQINKTNYGHALKDETIEKIKDLVSFVPKFNNKNGTFTLFRVNKLGTALYTGMNAYMKTLEVIKQNPKILEEKKELAEKIHEMHFLIEKQKADPEIEVEEKKCMDINPILENSIMLYIIIEEADKNDECLVEEGLKRLPDLGPKHVELTNTNNLIKQLKELNTQK